ncbi:glycosyltransferase [Thermodesulfobacteriota bacterium]
MKKVLFITTFFPPTVNVATSRIIKFLKYLPAYGWKAVVVCPASKKRHTDASRKSLMQLSESIQISPSGRNLFSDLVEQRNYDRFAVLLSQIMNNLIPPDGHLYWALNSLSHIGKLIENENPNLVFTTCNPYSLNLVGAWTKYKYDIPWVTDFRDLWTLNQQPKRFLNTYNQGVSKLLEDFYLKRCDQLIVTTENSKKRMIVRYPYLDGMVENIPNGFDQEDIQHDEKSLPIPNSFFYGGSIVANTRYNPISLLKLIAKALGNTEGRNWQFHYAGADGETFDQMLREAQIHVKCISHGYLSHDSFYDLIQKMEYILMCLPPDIDCRSWIPSRLYDYIGNKARIICLAPKDSEVFSLLRTHGNGLNLYYEKTEDIQTQKLVEYIFRDKQPEKVSESFANRFNREYLTKRLAGVFDQVISGYSR